MAKKERLEKIAGKAGSKWGPYLSERQWGTVREDYSDNGDAWNYFPHSQSTSRAYRWGEDGLGGISDDSQRLCFALALWNGRDPVLKERLFGLTGPQGNHGEDVKEYYYYLDATPNHSYLKYLYKYPQAEFPYKDLVETNAGRSKSEPEYELIDTGVFDEDRYFDVFVEYAKADPEDILIRVGIVNRGPAEASLRVLPTLWFRNTWAGSNQTAKPRLSWGESGNGASAVLASHAELGDYELLAEGAPDWLFVDNESNHRLLFGGENHSAYVKDGINDSIVQGKQDAVNPEGFGTKAAVDYALTVPPGETKTVKLRLRKAGGEAKTAFEDFDAIFEQRIKEADEFYQQLTGELPGQQGLVLRQALAGMIWTKQYYEFDVGRWLDEHHGKATRNGDWGHMRNHDIISMPDKWEYPWYAVWDSAFHTLALVLVDPDFAKRQLSLFLEERYLHPNGQIPAYEWNFSDVNPPVHAWAVRMVYHIDRERRGEGDIDFLKNAFAGLERNFHWWETRKGPDGDVYQGGFLGLDNIGVFDRSEHLPTGGHLEQSDGTAWMALYAQNMIQIGLELSKHDSGYQQKVIAYLDHFLEIAAAMHDIGCEHRDMWDDEDGFFYDVLRFPGGSSTRIKVRSLVGLLPLCAVTVIEADTLAQLPELAARYEELVQRKGHLAENISCPVTPGSEKRRLLAVLDEEKLRRVLTRLLDEQEFLSPYGIRSLSKYHQDHPYQFHWQDQTHTVSYKPGESDSYMFGGNSNWRGPVWLPANLLIVQALLAMHTYYGDDFQIECPTGSGNRLNLFQIAKEISCRLLDIFLPDQNGRRPVFGGVEKFQNDPHFRDHLLFYEYFHGDDGSGLGASHQTGWTGTLATLLTIFGSLDHEELLEGGMQEVVEALAGTDDATNRQAR
ncbi:MAG: glucosidase [Gammaproteobacteria bacterium HGW-Gammaproteobacteria-10]|nr:MAG: glucosidase [Gammaproteobacteria bacterium HGW-Gammaproteobacteria-10]